MNASGFVRPLLSVLLLTLTVLGLLNVYGDNADVVRQAEGIACSGCSPHMVQMGRSPISQTFAFQTEGSTVVRVTCKRALVLLGEYACVQEP